VALKAPGLVSALVLAGTGHTQTPASREALEKRAQAALGGMPTVADTTLERWFPPGFAERNPAVVETARGWLLDIDPVVFSWAWRAIRDLDHAAGLPGLAVPTLLVRGAEDASVPEARMRAMAELLSNATFVTMPGAGHLAPLEQPEAFGRLVEGFLAEQPAAAAG
jgi:pimeloyl-ACP methyl ester carboxylesterase